MKADPPSSYDPADPSAKAIQRTAAQWLTRRESQGFTETEKAAFAAWCAEDFRHAAVFAEVESAWRALDRLAAYPRSTSAEGDPDLLARPRPFRRAFVPILAAAAAIVMGGLIWPKPWISQSPVAGKAVTGTTSPFLHLADGSEVELKSGSEVAEEFTPGERRVRLVRGEAHFTVTKNPSRPFVVKADGVAVRAVGTAFDVRLEPTSVEVLVTEGKVQVRPPTAGGLASFVSSSAARASSGAISSPSSAEPPILIAGQREVISKTPFGAPKIAIETLAASEIDRALVWQTSRLDFDSTPLSEVVERLNRHTAGARGGLHLVVDDPQLGQLLISGRIRADNVENFVKVLKTSFGISAEQRPNGEIFLSKGP